MKLENKDWDKIGYDIPLLVNCMPAGKYLGEAFHRAGGVPTVMKELLNKKKIHGDALTVSGKTMAQNLRHATPGRRRGHQDLRRADAGAGGLRRAGR